LVLFTQPSLTGFVVANDVSSLGDFFGLILVLVGIVLVGMARESLEDISGVRITDQFKKATRNHDLRRIRAVIEKIKSGKGKREQLTHEGRHGQYSIRVGKQDRILYRFANGEPVIEDYRIHHYRE